ncbi:hypothetical protein EYF80_051957 [Liparis tanakae]|uniref:Uncharacterized protein n=1 Tax=Liparis tanakae TaxID=230148 RepID=A0A4Z2FAN8_9TELE|nr:hypothetical protein EYF80_051957 [Liparis tanakae]
MEGTKDTTVFRKTPVIKEKHKSINEVVCGRGDEEQEEQEEQEETRRRGHEDTRTQAAWTSKDSYCDHSSKRDNLFLIWRTLRAAVLVLHNS